MERKLISEGGILDYDPEFLSKDEGNKLYDSLISKVYWVQNTYMDWRRNVRVPIPRLTAWYADDPSMSYSYSGVTEKVQPWLPELLDLKKKIESVTNAEYNSVLINQYRDGRDSVGMHADDEKELGLNANIASISLGATRMFTLKHKEEELLYELTHGSLLVMSGTTQQHWKHGITKQYNVKEPRLNLTFRKFFTA